MEAKDIKWCPQHGYPLPCAKCGMPLTQVAQKEIFEKGKQAGIKEAVEWLYKETGECPLYNDGSFIIAKMRPSQWQAQLKEWRLE